MKAIFLAFFLFLSSSLFGLSLSKTVSNPNNMNVFQYGGSCASAITVVQSWSNGTNQSTSLTDCYNLGLVAPVGSGFTSGACTYDYDWSVDSCANYTLVYMMNMHYTQTFTCNKLSQNAPSGQVLNSGTCQYEPIATCTPPAVLDAVTNTCISPACPTGQKLDPLTSLCVPVYKDNQSNSASSTDQDFYNQTGCPTVSNPNDYIPTGMSSSSTGTKPSYIGSWTDVGTPPPTCEGYTWKCNYATHTFDKLTHRLEGNDCYTDTQSYTGSYTPKTTGDTLKEKDPCADDYAIYQKICTPAGYEGTCEHNGLYQTKNTLKCLSNMNSGIKKCDGLWNEKLNTTTNECQCNDGYTRNTWGICSQDLPPLATDQQKADKALQDQHDAQLKVTQDATKTNANNSNLQVAQNATNTSNNDATLSGIRRDLNSTNQALGDLNNELKNENNASNAILEQIEKNTRKDGNSTTDNDAISKAISSLDSNISGASDAMQNLEQNLSNIMGQYGEFSTNVKKQLEDVKNMYDSSKALFSAPRSKTMPSGSHDCFTFQFHGHTINFALCERFSIFAPIVYFVFTLIFMIATFRFTAHHLLKGLE